jgi:hypothetical protein
VEMGGRRPTRPVPVNEAGTFLVRHLTMKGERLFLPNSTKRGDSMDQLKWRKVKDIVTDPLLQERIEDHYEERPMITYDRTLDSFILYFHESDSVLYIPFEQMKSFVISIEKDADSMESNLYEVEVLEVVKGTAVVEADSYAEAIERAYDSAEMGELIVDNVEAGLYQAVLSVTPFAELLDEED